VLECGSVQEELRARLELLQLGQDLFKNTINHIEMNALLVRCNVPEEEEEALVDELVAEDEEDEAARITGTPMPRPIPGGPTITCASCNGRQPGFGE